MSSFEDVERFVKAHRECGTLTPSTSPGDVGGYYLTLTCSCGETFQRWITPEEAESGPSPPDRSPAPEPPLPEATAIEIPSVGATGESLEDVMKHALEELEAGKTPPPLEEREAKTTPPPPPPPSRLDAPRRPTTLPAGGPPRRERSAPKPDRGSLEEALRATLEALDAGAETDVGLDAAGGAPAPRTRATATGRPPVDDTPSESPAVPAAGTRWGRPPPDKRALQDALRATLDALEVERKTAPGGGPLAPGTAPRRRKLSLAGAIVISVALVGAVAAGYGLHELGQRPVDVVAATPTATVRPARVRVAQNERAAVSQAIAALRDVQSASRVDVPYRVYFNRVSFAKSDVERYLQAVRDADLRAALNEALGFHVLAATAWRAKTLNEREKWESVGDDPSIEACPGARRILAVGDEPPNMSRAQWRGMALAAGLPLLWDCAATRLAEIERGLSK